MRRLYWKSTFHQFYDFSTWWTVKYHYSFSLLKKSFILAMVNYTRIQDLDYPKLHRSMTYCCIVQALEEYVHDIGCIEEHHKPISQRGWTVSSSNRYHLSPVLLSLSLFVTFSFIIPSYKFWQIFIYFHYSFFKSCMMQPLEYSFWPWLESKNFTMQDYFYYSCYDVVVDWHFR